MGIRGQLLQEEAVDVVEGDVEAVHRAQDVADLQLRTDFGARALSDESGNEDAAFEDSGLLVHRRPFFSHDAKQNLQEESVVSRIVSVHDHVKMLKLRLELFRVELNKNLKQKKHHFTVQNGN